MTDQGPIPYATPPLVGDAPLSPEQFKQLAAARKSSRKIRRAINTARFDGWTLAIAAGLTFVFSIGDWWGMAIGLVLAGLAGIELYFAGRLRQLDPDAARMLGFNQLALATLIIAYAGWRIYVETSGRGELAQIGSMDPMAAQVLNDQGITQMVTSILILVYGGLIAVAICAQGGLALYYFTRPKYIRAHLSQTPPWIVAMQKADISI